MRRTVGGILAATAAAVMLATVPVLATVPASAATRRDPALQPFTVTSIWNTPLGRDARYVPARLRTPAIGVGLVTVATTTTTDPVAPVLSPDCTVAGRPQRLPASVQLPEVRTPQTLVVVAPNGRTVDTWTSATRCGSSLGGRYAGRTRLDGDGVPLGGAVAGLPGVGGAVRGQELTGSVPVRHALALLVPARYLAAGPRWPAVRSDGARSTDTTGPVVRLGALLALPPADAAGLPVTSAVGRRLLTALRDHGAYVAGVSDGDTVQLRTDLEAVAGYGTANGRPFVTDRRLRAELRAVIGALAVVADNAPGSVGGAGRRRAPAVAPLQKIRPDAGPSSSPGPSSATPFPDTSGAGTPAASPASQPAATPASQPAAAPASQPAATPASQPGAAPGSSAARLPAAAEADRPDRAPPAVVGVVAALALALLAVGLRAGRGLTRLFS
jgi:hypothetical protein